MWMVNANQTDSKFEVGAAAVIPSHYFHNVTGIVTITQLFCGGPLIYKKGLHIVAD